MYRTPIPAGYVDGVAHAHQYGIHDAWAVTMGNPSLPVGYVCGGVTATSSLPGMVGKTVSGTNIIAGGTDISDSGALVNTATAVFLAGASPWPGVAPDSPLLVAKYAATENAAASIASGTAQNWATAVRWLFDHGARIILAPQSFLSASSDLLSACQYVFNGGGIVVAAGGDGATPIRYPAHYSLTHGCVLSVGGVMTGGHSYNWSRRSLEGANPISGTANSPNVEVCAHVRSVGLRTQYVASGEFGYLSNSTGTATAAAIVAGLAHLLVSANPYLTGAQIKDCIASTVSMSPAGWRFTTGHTRTGAGILNASAAMAKALSLLPANASTAVPYLRVYSDDLSIMDDYAAQQSMDSTAKVYVNETEGTAEVAVHGAARWEIGGFAAGDTVTDVELWVNGDRLYKGPPTSAWLGNAPLITEYRNRLWGLRVIARTAGGRVASREYNVDVAGGGLGVAADAPSGGTVKLSGVRPPGATVTVTRG